MYNNKMCAYLFIGTDHSLHPLSSKWMQKNSARSWECIYFPSNKALQEGTPLIVPITTPSEEEKVLWQLRTVLCGVEREESSFRNTQETSGWSSQQTTTMMVCKRITVVVSLAVGGRNNGTRKLRKCFEFHINGFFLHILWFGYHLCANHSPASCTFRGAEIGDKHRPTTQPTRYMNYALSCPVCHHPLPWIHFAGADRLYSTLLLFRNFRNKQTSTVASGWHNLEINYPPEYI